MAGTPVDVPLDALEPSSIDLELDDATVPVTVKTTVPLDADRFVETHPGGGASVIAPVDAPAARPARTPSPVLTALRGWLFGGNTIVKAGIGILFIGLAFLAKFASEHVHVPVEFRLAAIAGVAVLLLGVGWRLRLRRAGYAQALQGGAIAVLYLTLFVAFRFYGVLSAPPVFAMMVLVAALAAALAVLQDARALAVIGALGGFATPLLVSTGSGNHIALFSYYLVLDLGIAAVAWHKTWRSLNLVAFFGTFIVATAWGALKYSPQNFASSEAFLIAFFLLFVVIMVLPARRALAPDATASHRTDAWVNSSLLFGLPTVVFALQYGLVRHIEYATALSALVMAAFYVGLARWMRSRPQFGLTFDASLAIGTVFLTLVIPFALDARSTAGAWALEGAGLVWIGLRQKRLLARAFGYLLLLLVRLLDGLCARAPRRSGGDLQRLPVQRADGGGRVLGCGLLRAAPCRARRSASERGDGRAAADRWRHALARFGDGARDWHVRSRAVPARRLARFDRCHRGAVRAPLGAARMASHRLACGRSRAVHGAGRARRRGVADEPGPWRRLVGLADRLRSPCGDPVVHCATLARAAAPCDSRHRRPRARRGRCAAGPRGHRRLGRRRPARGRGSAGSSFRRCCSSFCRGRPRRGAGRCWRCRRPTRSPPPR